MKFDQLQQEDGCAGCTMDPEAHTVLLHKVPSSFSEHQLDLGKLSQKMRQLYHFDGSHTAACSQ